MLESQTLCILVREAPAVAAGRARDYLGAQLKYGQKQVVYVLLSYIYIYMRCLFALIVFCIFLRFLSTTGVLTMRNRELIYGSFHERHFI